VLSVARLYNKDQMSLRVSPETAVMRIGDWCEMADSPGAEERPLLEAATKQRSKDRD
jgi:hypothetical protein